MVRSDTYMRRALLDHLQHGVEHAHHGAEWPVLSFGEATQAVEVAEEFVRTVDEMNNHGEPRYEGLEEPSCRSRAFSSASVKIDSGAASRRSRGMGFPLMSDRP
jgi:hypothetical protein